MSNIPKLRFKEFSGEWEERPLEDMINIASGISPSNYSLNSDSGLPFVKVEDLNNCSKYQLTAREYSASSRNVIKSGSIIFPKRGAAILLNKIRISQCDILMDSNMMALTIKSQNFSNEFLYYKILDEDLSKIADTSSIPQINNKHILPYKIFVPFVKEQQKIASFLSAVDTKIDQLTRKKELLEQYKKGVMQKIFSQELRFKADDGSEFPEWEEKLLKDVATKKSSNISANKIEKNFGDYIIYGASGVLKKVDFFEESEDYISIVKDGAGVGRIFYCKGKSSVLGTMDIIKPKSELHTYFLYCLLEDIDFVKYVTGSTIPHIYFKDYSNEKCKIPSYNEQTKIANFLSAIDTKIDLVAKQVDEAKNFKKGLLQQMFV